MLESVSVGEPQEGDDGRHGGASPDDDDDPAPVGKWAEARVDEIR